VSGATIFPPGNAIIDAVRGADATTFPTATLVTLERQQITTLQDRVMVNVDFPLDALMSVFALVENGSTAEVASVGPEGFVEIDSALRSDVSKRTSVCVFPGSVIRVPIAEFQRTLRENELFAERVYHSVRARAFMSEQLVICGLRHSVAERLSRWLLLASARIRRGELSLTHEQLADVLGIRRASVSVEAAELQALGAIRYTRGLVTIENRAVLADRACECFALCEQALNEG
jgi:CRP-like cAMP-binding protein